jgi:hypothetical protein
MKIRPVGAELSHADSTLRTATFHKFPNALNNGCAKEMRQRRKTCDTGHSMD